ncbi:hypothetical protein P7C71_g6347, partial [Lecanoromycetidae sp. Uapishka_2]
MHLLPYILVVLTASAIYVPLHPRVDPCEQQVEENEDVELDGPTTAGTAGIGAEFESPFFYFTNLSCSAPDTYKAKGQVINGRTGTNWKLTADTIGSMGGKVNAEYILLGQNIEVGSGDAAKAGAAIAQDLIDSPSKGQDPETLEWAPQITAPMPLEGLYSLMKEQLTDPDLDSRNDLDGFPTQEDGNGDGYLIVVTQKYFQSNTNGIDGSKVTDDVLAFCSLVLSYAKLASISLGPTQSPKLFTTFMPRTEFTTIYTMVENKIPGDLFTLFNSLACYTTENGNVVVDSTYCSGPPASPRSNNKFGALGFKNPYASVNIKSWIQGIGDKSPTPDLLSAFDKSIDGSIGGLGTQTEKMWNSQRSVPLFEFRDLLETPTSGFETFMDKVDTSIQALHRTFANPPQKRKRQVPASCIVTANTPAT